MKKKYIKPETKQIAMEVAAILAASQTLVIDPNQATGPACSKENKSYSVWNWEEDDFEDEDDY